MEQRTDSVTETPRPTAGPRGTWHIKDDFPTSGFPFVARGEPTIETAILAGSWRQHATHARATGGRDNAEARAFDKCAGELEELGRRLAAQSDWHIEDCLGRLGMMAALYSAEGEMRGLMRAFPAFRRAMVAFVEHYSQRLALPGGAR